jgi:hypothetical protein
MDARPSPGPRHAGVDWSWDGQAVCVLDADGTVLDRFDVEHRARALVGMCERLHRWDVGRVAIVRPDGPVVRALLEASFEVVVISPRQVGLIGCATAAPATRTTRSTPTCSPMRFAPTGSGWAR